MSHACTCTPVAMPRRPNWLADSGAVRSARIVEDRGPGQHPPGHHRRSHHDRRFVAGSLRSPAAEDVERHGGGRRVRTGPSESLASSGRTARQPSVVVRDETRADRTQKILQADRNIRGGECFTSRSRSFDSRAVRFHAKSQISPRNSAEINVGRDTLRLYTSILWSGSVQSKIVLLNFHIPALFGFPVCPSFCLPVRFHRFRAYQGRI